MRPMSLKASFEKQLVRPEGGSVRYLVVEVEAPAGSGFRGELQAAGACWREVTLCNIG